MQKLTIDHIAKLAYVSRTVVSRVLNKHPNVGAEARERVMQVIKEYNYIPNAAAQSLAAERRHDTHEISMLVPRGKDQVLADGFWSLLLQGMSEQCINRGYAVSLTVIPEVRETEINQRILHGRTYGGYLLLADEVADLVIPTLQSRGVPTVLMGHNPAYPRINSVGVNNVEGAYQAVTHLITLGHRRIAAIMGSLCRRESIDRLSGYKKALLEADLTTADDLILVGDYSRESGFECMQQLLEGDPCPTAVFCASDIMAIGALLALHQAGLAVPEDVAVVGFGDMPNASFAIPPLTTVHQPIYEQAALAAEILLDQIEGKRTEVVHVQLDADLVVRETCGAAKGIPESNLS